MSSKQEKAVKLIEKGSILEILSEDEFLKNLCPYIVVEKGNCAIASIQKMEFRVPKTVTFSINI